MTKELSLVVYILVFSLSIASYSCSTIKRLKTKYKWLFFILSIALVVVFAALRHNVGTDYRNYNTMLISKKYSSLKTFFADKDTEVLFYFLNSIGRKFSSIHLNMLIYSLITVIFFHLAIKVFGIEKDSLKENESGLFNKNTIIAYSVFLFTVFPTSFNQVRQAMAMSIVFLAIAYLYKKDYKKFVIWVVIASTIHLTAIFFLSLLLLDIRLYFQNSEKVYKKYIIPVAFLLFVLIMALNFVFFIGILTKIPFIEHYSYLVENIDIGGNRDLILNAAILIGVIIFAFKSYKNNIDLQVLLSFILFTFILSLTGLSNPFAKRISMYMDLVYIIFFVKIASNRETLKMKNIFALGLLFYSISRFILVYYIMGNSEIFPYAVNLFIN